MDRIDLQEIPREILLASQWLNLSAGLRSGFPEDSTLDWAVALTGAVFFGIGSLKSRWSLVGWWRSGVETTVIGLGAALIAFGIGFGLKSFI